MHKVTAPLVLAAALSACASLDNAGYTEATLSGSICGQPVDLSYKSGKEFGSIAGSCAVDPSTKANKASFTVEGVKAFEGQQLSAAVAQGVTAGIKDAVGAVMAAGKVAAGGVAP